MKISPELSEKIETLLQKYVSNPEPVWADAEKTINLREIAAKLKVLPLYLDWSGAFGIRPNGDFFSFIYNKPYGIKKDYNQREINGVLFQGLKNYPELKELMPVRTSESIECNSCQGTGIAPLAEQLSISNLICYCGGLGWLPPNENNL